MIRDSPDPHLFQRDSTAGHSSLPPSLADEQVPLGITGEEVISARRVSGSSNGLADMVNAGEPAGAASTAAALPRESSGSYVQRLHRRFPSTGMGKSAAVGGVQ